MDTFSVEQYGWKYEAQNTHSNSLFYVKNDVRVNTCWWHSHCQVSRCYGYTSTQQSLGRSDYCLYSFRLEQSQKKDYNRRTAESVVFLKEVTLESLWVSLLFISERKMKQIQFYIPPNPSQNSGWTEVLAQHYAFTEVGKEHATRTRGWFHVCTITHRTSQNFFQVRNTYQILQPPSRIDEIAQTWFIKNLDNSI